jgi:hypothetical protein
MILKQEITELATSLQLPSTTVEKDYILSWVLYGISQNPAMSHMKTDINLFCECFSLMINEIS